jgi:hypothetical protein
MLPESTFTLLFDLRYTLHSLDCGLDELSVIPNGDIASFLELDGGILGPSETFCQTYGKGGAYNSHFLSGSFTEGFSPSHFTRISFHSIIILSRC